MLVTERLGGVGLGDQCVESLGQNWTLAPRLESASHMMYFSIDGFCIVLKFGQFIQSHSATE